MDALALRLLCLIVGIVISIQALPPGPTEFPGGPGPIFSFGQNVLPAHSFLQRASTFYVEADNGQFMGCLFSSIVGITDKFAVFAAPFWVQVNEFDKVKNTGLGFTLLQAEYAFYNHHTDMSAHQMTIVAAARIGGTTPFTTFWTPKSPAYFIGLTQSHRSKHWYGYSAFGGHICTTYKGEKPGNRFVFDLGGGRTLLDHKDYFLSFLLECSSFYRSEDKINLTNIVESCPHFIFFGPTFYFAHKHFFLYVGFQYPIVQVCNDIKNNRVNYRFSTSWSWLF
jgi:hypothetical protein